jgi:hypothetical protein
MDECPKAELYMARPLVGEIKISKSKLHELITSYVAPLNGKVYDGCLCDECSACTLYNQIILASMKGE